MIDFLLEMVFPIIVVSTLFILMIFAMTLMIIALSAILG